MKAQVNGTKEMLAYVGINTDKLSEDKISRRITLFSPVNGYISKVNINVGKYCSPTDVLFEIIDTEHIHLELSVFEKDILKINKGQKIDFRIPEASDSIYKAEVHLVGTTIDPTSRRVKVHGHIEDDHTRFIVGMFAEAEVIVGSSKGMALPKTAVIQVEDDYFALVLNSETANEFHFTKVKLDIGLQTENIMEVLNAVSLINKKIVVDGTYMLLNESEGGGHSH